MHFTSLAVVSSLLTSSVFAAPFEKRETTAQRVAKIKNAVYAWQNDTGKVSEFLNLAQARDFNSQSAFHSAAVAAHANEENELVHKAVLDKQVPHSQEIETANTTLVTDGTFQAVVDLLEDLTELNFYTQATEIQDDVNQINFGNSTIAGRCFAVLPAIDMYFNAAAKEVQKLDGDDSLFSVSAISPTACSQTTPNPTSTNTAWPTTTGAHDWPTTTKTPKPAPQVTTTGLSLPTLSLM